MDWRQQPVSHALLDRLADALRLSPDQQRHAHQLAGLDGTTRPASELAASIHRLLLALGLALVLAGTATFFAWNWQQLGAFGRFAMLQSGLLASMLIAVWRGLDTASGQAFLLTGFVLIGLLLAVFGQTYQTGADAFQLFLSWALLSLPLVVAARSVVIIWLWQALLTISLTLYWVQMVDAGISREFAEVFGPAGWLLAPLSDWRLSLLLLALSALALLAWELGSHRLALLPAGKRWPMRASLCLAFWAITPIVLRVIVDADDQAVALVSLSYTALVLVCLWFYSAKRLDLGNLSLTLLSLITVLTTALARLLADGDETGLILVALALVVQASLAATWLTRLNRARHHRPGSSAP